MSETFDVFLKLINRNFYESRTLIKWKRAWRHTKVLANEKIYHPFFHGITHYTKYYFSFKMSIVRFNTVNMVNYNDFFVKNLMKMTTLYHNLTGIKDNVFTLKKSELHVPTCYQCLWSEHHHTTQTSKLKKKLNGASTMLNKFLIFFVTLQQSIPSWLFQSYTERQKKLITSSEQHSLKSKASKLIIFGHSLAIVLLTKHTYNKQTFVWVKK